MKKIAMMLAAGGMLAAFGGAGSAFADGVGACNAESASTGNDTVLSVPDPRGPLNVYGDLDQDALSGYLGVAGSDGFIQLSGSAADGPQVEGATSDNGATLSGKLNSSGICLAPEGNAINVPPAA